jgi:hypothetical protein
VRSELISLSYTYRITTNNINNNNNLNLSFYYNTFFFINTLYVTTKSHNNYGYFYKEVVENLKRSYKKDGGNIDDLILWEVSYSFFNY